MIGNTYRIKLRLVFSSCIIVPKVMTIISILFIGLVVILVVSVSIIHKIILNFLTCCRLLGMIGGIILVNEVVYVCSVVLLDYLFRLIWVLLQELDFVLRILWVLLVNQGRISWFMEYFQYLEILLRYFERIVEVYLPIVKLLNNGSPIVKRLQKCRCRSNNYQTPLSTGNTYIYPCWLTTKSNIPFLIAPNQRYEHIVLLSSLVSITSFDGKSKKFNFPSKIFLQKFELIGIWSDDSHFSKLFTGKMHKIHFDDIDLVIIDISLPCTLPRILNLLFFRKRTIYKHNGMIRKWKE